MYIINASELKNDTLYQQLYLPKQNKTAHCTDISHVNIKSNYCKCMRRDTTNNKHSIANKLNCPRNCTLPILCLTNIDYTTTHTHTHTKIYRFLDKQIMDVLHFIVPLCHQY